MRAPDIVVISLADARAGLKRCRPDQVRVAIEIVSPGSVRVDRVAKMADYAEASIPNYWIIDLEGEVTLDAFTLVDATYQPSMADVTGKITMTDPIPLTIDLAALMP